MEKHTKQVKTQSVPTLSRRKSTDFGVPKAYDLRDFAMEQLMQSLYDYGVDQDFEFGLLIRQLRIQEWLKARTSVSIADQLPKTIE